MKHVLVTGVNGFVGNHIAKELADNGYDVIGIGRPQGKTSKSALISKYIIADLTNLNAVQQIDFTHIDAIIHLAGLAAVGPSFDNPMDYIKTNMGMEVNIFQTIIKQQATPKILIISSGSLYDAHAPLPLTEGSACAPTSPYAVSKLGQEQLAVYYSQRGFDCVIARPFNHIGPGQNSGFIVPDLTKQVIASEQGKSTEILVGNLDAKRDYTDVRDIARAYRLLLETGRSNEIYNVCSAHSFSGHDILNTILAASTISPIVRQDSSKMRPADSPEIYGSYDKLYRDTGWMPAISLESTIQDVLTDWRSRT